MGNNITPKSTDSVYANMDMWNTQAQFLDKFWYDLYNHQSIDMRYWPSGIYFLNEPFTQDILYTLYVSTIWTFLFVCWILFDLWN